MSDLVRGSFAKGFGRDPLYAESVPAPWTPVLWNGRDGRVECWGRTYGLGGILPDSIVSQGVELLARPIQFQAISRGRTLKQDNSRREIVVVKEGLVRVGTECSIGDIEVSCQTSIEFDGMVRLDLRFAPSKPVVLDSLDLVVPLRREVVSLFHHYPVQMIWWEPADRLNSGALPEDGLRLPFTYHVWLGNDEVGLQWFAESDEGFSPRDSSAVITVTPVEDCVELRVNVLSDTVLDGAFLLTFGLMASPVKPFRVDWHNWRYSHQAQWGMVEHRHSRHPLKDGEPATGDLPSWLDELHAAGARFLAFHEWWSAEQSLARPYYADRFRSILDAVHTKGMKLIVYTGVYMSEIAPEFDPSWRVGPPERMYVYDRRAYEDREPPQRAHITCWNTPYPDLLVRDFSKLFRQFEVDGIYTDGLTVPLPCTNAEHGCGYMAADGEIRPTVAVFAARELMKRLHAICRSRGEDTLLVSHTSACVLLPVLSTSDIYLDGEHLMSKKRPGTSELPLEALRAEMCGHNYGIPCCVLPSNDPVFGRDYPRGIALIHDVIMPWSIADQRDIWLAFQRFQPNGYEWIPYWKSRECFDFEPEDVLVSAYTNVSGTALLAVMNPGSEPRLIRLRSRSAATTTGGSARAEDAVTGERLRADDGYVEFGVEAGSFRMVILE